MKEIKINAPKSISNCFLGMHERLTLSASSDWGCKMYNLLFWRCFYQKKAEKGKSYHESKMTNQVKFWMLDIKLFRYIRDHIIIHAEKLFPLLHPHPFLFNLLLLFQDAMKQDEYDNSKYKLYIQLSIPDYIHITY